MIGSVFCWFGILDMFVVFLESLMIIQRWREDDHPILDHDSRQPANVYNAPGKTMYSFSVSCKYSFTLLLLRKKGRQWHCSQYTNSIQRLSKMFYSGVLVIVLRLFGSLIREKDQATLSASEKHICGLLLPKCTGKAIDWPTQEAMSYSIRGSRLHLSPRQFLPTIRELFFSEHAHRKRSGYRSTW